MRIAITGGTGFIGKHLAQRLAVDGHEVVLLARGKERGEEIAGGMPKMTYVPSDLADQRVLAEAFVGCHSVAHCAGINRELGNQTFHKVHVEATKNVVQAARRAGVKKIVLMSFLRARADCGSPYHESKWSAEQIIVNSGLDYTVIKAGMVYGLGDHMLNHLSHALHTFPVFGLVGFKEKGIRPLAIEDLVEVLQGVLVKGRLTKKSVALTGAEELYLSEAVRRVARVTGHNIHFLPVPVSFHYILARLWELTMKVPLVARTQVRILSEGVVEPALPCDPLPSDLVPTRRFTDDQIRKGLPRPGPFTLSDLRCCA